MTGRATAPASSGNLGPGFDCLALALDLRCVVTAIPADDWVLAQDGVTTLGSESDLVVRAVRMTVGRPMRLEIDNAVPRSRGLGSSSAVTTAAAVAAMRATGKPVDADHLFRVIAELEGHADNAAAAVYGGLVLTDHRGNCRHLGIAPSLGFVVAVPHDRLSTREARAALPPDVPRAVAARTIARVGFLIEGLRTGDRDALAAAGGDEIHELPRHDLSPITGELIAVAREAGALHAAWSGAGPSTLAVCTDDTKGGVMEALSARLDDAGAVMALEVSADGFR